MVRRFGAAYMVRVPSAVCSANSWIRAVCATASCATAVRRPSASAPSRTRWTVAVRYPAPANDCRRGIANFTARPGTARAASATSTWCALGRTLLPNAPPTCGDTTSTRSGDRPSTDAMTCRVRDAPCVESYRVRPPSRPQRAIVECGSIGTWYCSGVVYV